MRLDLNPLGPLREKAEGLVNQHFNQLAAGSIQQDQEHRRKREIAEQVLSQGAHVAPDPFVAEAALSGMSAEDLAAVIRSKPDDVAERGLARRKAILAVRAARTPKEIRDVLRGLGIPDNISLTQG